MRDFHWSHGFRLYVPQMSGHLSSFIYIYPSCSMYVMFTCITGTYSGSVVSSRGAFVMICDVLKVRMTYAMVKPLYMGIIWVIVNPPSLGISAIFPIFYKIIHLPYICHMCPISHWLIISMFLLSSFGFVRKYTGSHSIHRIIFSFS